MVRLFVAIKIPESLYYTIDPIVNDLSKIHSCSIVPSQNLHFTLLFIGEVDEKNISFIQSSLNTIKFSRFVCKLNSFGAFPVTTRAKIAWVGAQSNNNLELLASCVRTLLSGFVIDKKPFLPHLTIARFKNQADLSSIEERFSKTNFGSFEVNCFHLIKSDLTPSGAKYQIISTYQLD